jgi:hypothetical protein
MARLDLPEPYSEIDQLIEAGDTTLAEQKLAQASGDAQVAEVVRVKLGLVTGALAPGMAMQRLVQLMRTNAKVPGAQALYQEASRLSYVSRESSLAHSHPPPPVVESKERGR